MKITAPHLLCAILTLSAPAALAQRVPFRELVRGEQAPATLPEGGAVFRSAEDLGDYARLLPLGARVDWSQEMLVAVVSEPRSREGYSITVRLIQESAASGALEVHALKRAPHVEGRLSTSDFYRPFQVVRLPRSETPLRFWIQAPLGFQARYELRTLGSSGPQVREVWIDTTGRAHFKQTGLSWFDPLSPQGTQPSARTSTSALLTPYEREDLEAALRGAQLSTIPALPIRPGASQSFQLEFGLSDSEPDVSLQGDLQDLGPYGARLAPVLRQLEQIADRVQGEATQQAEQVWGRIESVRGNVLTLRTAADERLTVAVDALDAEVADYVGLRVSFGGSWRTGHFVARSLVSPIDAMADGTLSSDAEGLFIDRSHFEVYPPLPALRLEGPLTSVLQRVTGHVVLKGKLFTGERRPLLFVREVRAYAKADARALPRGSVARGEALTIVQRILGRVRVLNDAQASLWLPLDQLSFAPLAPAAESRGPAASASAPKGSACVAML